MQDKTFSNEKWVPMFRMLSKFDKLNALKTTLRLSHKTLTMPVVV